MATDLPLAADEAAHPTSPASSSRPRSSWLRWFGSFAAGAIAGYVAFFGIREFGFLFQLPEHLIPLLDKQRLSPEEVDSLIAAETLLRYQNTAVQVAILGAAAGCLLGLVEGLARRSFRTTLIGGLGGMLLGGLAGAAGGIVDLYVLSRLWDMQFETIFKAMAAHSIAFLLVGLGMAIVVGLTRGRVVPTVGVVLAAALIAGLIYPGLAASIWPVPNTDAAVPLDAMGPLLLWTMLPTLLMALAIARTGRPLVPSAPR